MAGDKSWLAKSLAAVLGWDQVEIEPVVEAIASASDESQLEELIQGYLGGSTEVREKVEKFLGSARKEPKSSSARYTDPRGRQQRPGERQAGSVKVRHVAGRQQNAAASSSTGPQLPEREVCNCISCGKIYVTRADTADTNRFLENGGYCTFCGAKVALSYDERSEARASASQGAGPSSSGAREAEERAEAEIAEARAFKDRLVDYDRNSRQRTTVVDDQNDFFEIDTNAWLDKDEREQLKRQEKELQEAEEARKRRVTVTFDLLGRKVLMADEPALTRQDLQNADASRAAARATGAEIRQGGGTATRVALQAANRITPNTSLTVERPVFVQTVPETDEERRKRRGLASARPEKNPEPEQKGVVGGWDDETGSRQTAAFERDRLGRSILPPGFEAPQHAASTPAAAERKSKIDANKATTKKAKRPQLKRLQHDDLFKDVDAVALDDIRPED